MARSQSPKEPDGLREALLSPPERADLDSVAQHFTQIVGGPKALAKLLYDEFQNADQGSPIRARVMEMIFRSLGKLEGRATDNLEGMADEDLERLFNSKIRRMSDGPAAAGDPATSGAEVEAEGQAEAGSAEEATETASGDAVSSDAE